MQNNIPEIPLNKTLDQIESIENTEHNIFCHNTSAENFIVYCDPFEKSMQHSWILWQWSYLFEDDKYNAFVQRTCNNGIELQMTPANLLCCSHKARPKGDQLIACSAHSRLGTQWNLYRPQTTWHTGSSLKENKTTTESIIQSWQMRCSENRFLLHLR